MSDFQREPSWVQRADGYWYPPDLPQGPPPLPAAGPAPVDASKKVGAGCTAVVLVLAVAFGLWIAFRPKDSEAEKERDRSSLACDHFRNIAGDYSDGILTFGELRSKLKEVHDDAIIGTPRVRSAATALLAATTAGDIESMLDEVTELGDACAAAGH